MGDYSAQTIADTSTSATQEESTSAARAWADKGPKCEQENHAVTDLCFLDTAKRGRYVGVIREQVAKMQTNYKLALTQLRFDELMKEEEDVSWVVSLVLDIAGAHLLGLALKGLKKVKGAGIEKLAGNIVGAHRSGEAASSVQRQAFDTLTSFNESTLQSWTKSAFDMGKMQAKKAAKHAANVDETTEKNMVVSFTDELSDSADTGFSTFMNRSSANSDDVALIILFEALQGADTSVGFFHSLLGEKLQRFRASGALDIGRKQARDNSVSPSTEVLRDTRVVWVVGPDGNKRLYYQSQDIEDDPAVFSPGDPGTSWIPKSHEPQKFGKGTPHEAPHTRREVSQEFAATAMDISMQRWGEVPTLDPFHKLTPPANLNDYHFGSDEDSAPSHPKPVPAHDDKPAPSVAVAPTAIAVPDALNYPDLLRK